MLVVAPEWEDRPEEDTGVLRIPAIQDVTDMGVSFPLPVQSMVEETVRELQPDIIHSHHPYMLGSMALRVAAQHLVPLVFTHHTRYEFYAHYVRRDSAPARRFAARLGTGYCELADQVIAPSESIRQLLKERGVETPIEAIPTGVDLQKYAEGDRAAARERFGIPAGCFLCGTVSRLAPEKNVGFLVQAVARYLRRNQAAHFLVVGYGPAENSMRKMCEEMGVADRCSFAGKTTGQELVDAYHAMDAFAFASNTETQGMVLVEALAAGCPLVALDAPGTREVVRDGENGRLIQEEDEDAFAGGLSWVAERAEEEPESLPRRARQSASPFSVDRCGRRVLALYEEVAKRGPAVTGSRNHWAGALREFQRDLKIWGNRLSALIEALRTAEEQPP